MTVITRAVRPLALAIISSCLLPTAALTADGPSKITAAVDLAFRPLLKANDVPGTAVAVTVDGQQSFFSYGVASKDARAATALPRRRHE